jgi:hypothetical protein
LPALEQTLTIRPPRARPSRRGGAHEPHRREDVELPLDLPVVVGQVVDRPGEARARVVDEHVDAAHLLGAGATMRPAASGSVTSAGRPVGVEPFGGRLEALGVAGGP